MTSREQLVQLVRRTDRTGLTNRYVDSFPPGTAYIDFVAPPNEGLREGGKFHPDHDQIDIYREGRLAFPEGSPTDLAAASPDPTAELTWLAHELGHLDSKLRGNPQPLTPGDDPTGTFREELRAWAYARRRLEPLGFQEWETFDRLRTVGLESYRVGLEISAVEAEAIADAVSRE